MLNNKGNLRSWFYKFALIAALAWTLIISVLFIWDISRILEHVEDLAMREARSNFSKDMAFRYWAASHGGVYVPIDERTPPNPYLTEVEERDITTPSGKKLTLMNPAYIMRQVNEYFMEVYGVAGNLTSLNPLNPDNQPDEWEKEALQAFEEGVEEVSKVSEIGGQQYLRLMRPNFVEPGCLKCHAHQGYDIGDVRGGLSVSIPMKKFDDFKLNELYDHTVSHLIIWLLGLLGLRYGYQRISEQIDVRLGVETERARLFTAIEQLNEVVVITDKEGAIQYVNRAFESTTGYSREEAIGANPRVLKSGRHDLDFYKNLWKTITAGATWKGDFINKRKDGTLYEEEASISPVTGPDGEIAGFVAVKRDVTRESMLQKAKDYFTAVTSHEIRTPLTKLNLTKLLLERIASSGQMDSESLAASVEGLGASIEEFEKIMTTGEMFTDLAMRDKPLYRSKISIVPVARYCLELAKSRLEKGGRDIAIESSIQIPKGEDSILADHNTIQYAISEILSNAAKYTPDGKRIFFSMSKHGDEVSIIIRDEGIGMKKESIDMAFQTYFSLEAVQRHFTGKYEYLAGGIGMGLSLSRMIMESHGGALKLESAGEGQGVTVTMVVPISKPS